MSAIKVLYREFRDIENLENPNGENIAELLEEEIRLSESRFGLKLASACFLGEKDVLQKGGNSVKYSVCYKKVHEYMLFFN